MNPRDLGKQRTSPVTQIGNNDFNHVYDKEVKPIGDVVRFALVKEGYKNLPVACVPVEKVEQRKEYWNKNGITYNQLGK